MTGSKATDIFEPTLLKTKGNMQNTVETSQ